HGVPGAGGSDDIDVQAAFTQTRQGRTGALGRAAATRGGVHDGEKTLHAREYLMAAPVLRLSESPGSQRKYGGGAIQPREPLRKDVSLNLQGSGARKVLSDEDDPMNSLVV